jgi:CRP-like cAMP-binding protein
MNTSAVSSATMSPLATRLSSLAPLATADLDALRTAERDARKLPARREFVTEGDHVAGARAVLSGWACRVRVLADGRRQILGFVLPGDLIGLCRHSHPIAPTTILAVTEVVTCAIPPAEPGTGLFEAYARSAALDEHHLLAQITRLGRLSAYERLADWFLETRDRLAIAGLCGADQFTSPMTQEMLADTLGLTSVHVNRMLQALRRDGLISSRSGMVTLPDRPRLAKLIGYKPAAVTFDRPPLATMAKG